MENTKYNGWTNYATWRINLEVFDCSFDPYDYWDDYASIDLSELADRLQDNANEYVFNHGSLAVEGSLVESYARSFMSDVNWYEIAQSVLDCYPQTEEVNHA
jgi:hypothetical protein